MVRIEPPTGRSAGPEVVRHSRRITKGTSMTSPNSNATASTRRSRKPERPVDTEMPGGKTGIMITLLSRPGGATIAAMMEATGWQAHSVRGFMAGTLKRKLGRTVASEKVDDVRVYRIADKAA